MTFTIFFFFFFNDTATTEIYTLSLHDALPICEFFVDVVGDAVGHQAQVAGGDGKALAAQVRSEEHTSELQSHSDLVCRLLLEKKKNTRLFPWRSSVKGKATEGAAEGVLVVACR